MKEKIIIVLSGGMDSTALLYEMAASYPNHSLLALTFDYGQKHRKEIEFARHHAAEVGAQWILIPMGFLKDLLPSALTSEDINVPEGKYAPDTLAASVVPNRNSIMLNIAAGIAVGVKAKYIALGVHDNDTETYPDCRFAFIQATERALKLGNAGYLHPDFAILTPYIHGSKGRIISDLLSFYSHKEATTILSNTWSCYKGEEMHCGRCSTCLERKAAFAEVNIRDLTGYANANN